MGYESARFPLSGFQPLSQAGECAHLATRSLGAITLTGAYEASPSSAASPSSVILAVRIGVCERKEETMGIRGTEEELDTAKWL